MSALPILDDPLEDYADAIELAPWDHYVDPDDAERQIASIVPDAGGDPTATYAQVEWLTMAILESKANSEAEAAAWKAVETQARAKLIELMNAVKKHNWVTSIGKAYVAADGASTSYDAAALDALVKSSPALAQILLPHRKETPRKGGLTVKGVKS